MLVRHMESRGDSLQAARYEAAGAACGSLVLHALLIAIMASTSSFDFLIGRETRFDILWISPQATPEAPVPVAAAESPPEDPEEMPVKPLKQPSTQRLTRPAARRHLTPANDVAADLRPVHDSPPAEPPAQMVMALPAPVKQKKATAAPKEPAVSPAPKESAVAAQGIAPLHDVKPVSSARNREDAGIAPEARKEPKKEGLFEHGHEAARIAAKPALPFPAPASPVQAAASKPQGTPSAPSLSKGVTFMAPPVEATLPKAQTASQLPLQPAAVTIKSGPASAAMPSAPGSIQVAAPAPAKAPPPAVAATSSPAGAVRNQASARPVEKAPQPKGLVIAQMHGDLKLVMTGDSGIKLTVLFREYPKSRRKKVLTRAESRREQKIMPVIAKTREKTREAVIETAREGIYLFIAEPEKGETVRESFSLKIFEGSPREKVAAIGSRTVDGKTVVAKVLMPEGILWDDESAFTGSLEDSDSVTKFNAQTGVYWKEYND